MKTYYFHNTYHQVTHHNSVDSVPTSNLVCINPLPHDKIFDPTKLKAFADSKLKVTKMIISVFDRVKNIEVLRMTTPSSMAASRFKYNT